jgi:hypothetical protein
LPSGSRPEDEERVVVTGRRVSLLLLLCPLVAVASCTSVRVREHTRESYLAPSERELAEGRLVEAPRARVWRSALAELHRRGFALEEVSLEAGRISAARRFRAGRESSQFAELGAISKLVTRTTRRYRSFDPRHLRCKACIVREGRLVSSQTAILERSSHPIDADLEARVVVTVRSLAPGSWLQVRLELEPVDLFDSVESLEPRSSGAFERGFIEAVAASSRSLVDSVAPDDRATTGVDAP